MKGTSHTLSGASKCPVSERTGRVEVEEEKPYSLDGGPEEEGSQRWPGEKHGRRTGGLRFKGSQSL